MKMPYSREVSTRSRPKAAGLGDKTSTWTRFVSTRSRPKAAGHTHLERKAVGMFQHAAARRRLVRVMWGIHRLSMFQHAAARRRLGIAKCRIRKNSNCFNTQPPEGGWEWIKEARKHIGLFQHAAARRRLATGNQGGAGDIGFNTQPPEGGWFVTNLMRLFASCFNTQPPEGGWICRRNRQTRLQRFNTQPPEGGWHHIQPFDTLQRVSTRSRPKAAGWKVCNTFFFENVSTRSRPKAAGAATKKHRSACESFNTQPPEGGWMKEITNASV